LELHENDGLHDTVFVVNQSLRGRFTVMSKICGYGTLVATVQVARGIHQYSLYITM
jgi:hypothetical protein